MKLSYRAARFSHRLVLLAATSLLATTAPTVRAERASSSEMSRACENWLTQVVFTRGAWAGAAAPTVLGAHELAVGDTLLARYYDISPRGFVLVAALKEMTPVKAYSDRYNLDDSQSGGFLAMITEQLANRTRLYAEMFGSLEAAQPPEGPALFGRGQKAEWTRLTLPAGEFGADLAAQAARATRDGGPLCTTSWDQGYPYNKFCPQGQYGTSVVGCVATAASQVIAYWQWPPSGVGSHTYYWDGDQYCGGNYGGGYLTASYSDSYDWANIVDSCSLGCTPAQEDAVAELCYEVGVAFDMDYSSCGSAAYTGQAVLIYPQYFKFSPDVRRVDRSAYSLHEWFDLVKNEIDSGRVVQYRINLHSIVLDGYREQIPGRYEYHMNYGWADAFNAWYVFDSLYCGWIEGDICPASEEYMITHIFPQTQPVLQKVGEEIIEAGGDGNGRPNPGEAVDLNIQVVNNGWDAVNPAVTLSTDDPYIAIEAASASLGDTLAWGETGFTQTPLKLAVDAGCPDPHVAVLHVTMAAEGGHTASDSIRIFIGNSAGLASDFEVDDNRWWHRPHTQFFGDQWHRETYRKHSGATSWKVGGTGGNYYDNALDAALTSPPFLLPPNAVLSFWHWRNIESPTDAWDGAIVMISVAGGSWQQVFPEGGYPDTIVDNPANALPGGTPCYSGDAEWSEAVFDLSAYAGVAQVMFRFASDGALTYEGWYVDDVAIVSTGCCLGLRGNVDGDAEDEVGVSDLTALVAFLFRGGPAPACDEEANIDGSGILNVADLTTLINYLFRGGPPPAACP